MKLWRKRKPEPVCPCHNVKIEVTVGNEFIINCSLYALALSTYYAGHTDYQHDIEYGAFRIRFRNG